MYKYKTNNEINIWENKIGNFNFCFTTMCGGCAFICGGSPTKFVGIRKRFSKSSYSSEIHFEIMTGVISTMKITVDFHNSRNAQKLPKYTFLCRFIILPAFSLFTWKHTLNIQHSFQNSLIQVIKDALCTYLTYTSINLCI